MKLTKVLRVFLLWLVMALFTITLNQQYVFHYLGNSLSQLVFLLTFFACALTVVMTAFYMDKSLNKNIQSKSGIYLFSCLVLYFVFLFLVGIFRVNPKSYVLLDTSTFILFFCFILLGSKKQFWNDFIPAALFFSFISVLINLDSANIISTAVHRYDIDKFTEYEGKERIAVMVLAYDTQHSLTMWPFFLLTCYKKNSKYILFAFAMLIVYFGLQIMFQKRAPSVRVMLFFLSFLIFIPLITKQRLRDVFKWKVNLSLITLLSLLVYVITLFVPMKLIQNQTQALMDRFSGKNISANVSYSSGALGIFTTENERMFEVGLMMDDLNPAEHFIGKGMGGYFSDELGYFGFWDYDLEAFTKNTTHLGFFTLYLKGGIILLLVYFGLIIHAIFPISKNLKDVRSTACLFFILLYTLFQFAEGWFLYPSDIFGLILFSLSIGVLISNKRKYAYSYNS